MADETRYLIIVSLHKASVPRIAAVVAPLKAVLAAISKAPVEQAFRTTSADTFGYLISSKLAAGQILAIIESPGGGHDFFERKGAQLPPPFLDNADEIQILSLGDDHKASRNLGRITAWLQHH